MIIEKIKTPITKECDVLVCGGGFAGIAAALILSLTGACAVAAFAKATGPRVTSAAAKALYTGMVTDSGRFRFRSVSGDTMRYAGMLLDMGIDSDRIYANLYMKAILHI